MIDAIFYISDITEFGDSELAEMGAITVSGNRGLIYTRVNVLEYDARITVLASAFYTGIGTADHVYQQVKDDAEKLAIYETVYDTSPRVVDDGEGDTMEFTPPFKFGMLAESVLRVPRDITARQARLVLVQRGLFGQVDGAITSIDDAEQRQIAEIEWEYATRIEREAPWVNALYGNLGLTKKGVDHLFIEASEL